MKRKMLGIAAITIAIVASAFTVPSSKAAGKFTSYKWFGISGSVSLNAAVPRADATYLGEGTTAPNPSGCATSSVHQCVSGFNASQVNSSNQLINDMQTPQVQPYQKN